VNLILAMWIDEISIEQG